MKTIKRTYGRTELAQLYFPELTPAAAWRKLHMWLTVHPELRKLSKSRLRTFTPKEVTLIFDCLGEP